MDHSGKGDAGMYRVGNRRAEEEEEGRDSFGMVSRQLRTPEAGGPGQASPGHSSKAARPAQPGCLHWEPAQGLRGWRAPSTTGAEQGTQHVPHTCLSGPRRNGYPKASKTRRIYMSTYSVPGTPPAHPHAVGTDSGSNFTMPPSHHSGIHFASLPPLSWAQIPCRWEDSLGQAGLS